MGIETVNLYSEPPHVILKAIAKKFETKLVASWGCLTSDRISNRYWAEVAGFEGRPLRRHPLGDEELGGARAADAHESDQRKQRR